MVTYLLDGEFFHRDSKGHDQVARGGDVNWMRSGSGIVHSEGPATAFSKQGGRVQLLQIWINLPAALKQQAASFTHYPAAAMPVLENEDYWMKIILGSLEGKQSAIETLTPLFLYHYKVKKEKLQVLSVNPQHTAGLYVLQGNVKVLNKNLVAGELIEFNTDGDQLAFTGTPDAELIVFGGAPIKEKVVSYGPFVMNSIQEVQEAIANYESGKMGVLQS